MRFKVVKRARMFVLYAALMCGMIFSAMTLSASTVYAACDCQRIAQDVASYCSVYGGVQYFSCTASEMHFKCAYSSFFGGPCQ